MEINIYKPMYAMLCGVCSDAVELLDAGRYDEAREALTAALLRAEDMYIEAGTVED